MSLAIPIGMAIGPVVGSFLVVAYGYVPLFIFCSTLASVSLLCSIFVWEPDSIVGKKLPLPLV